MGIGLKQGFANVFPKLPAVLWYIRHPFLCLPVQPTSPCWTSRWGDWALQGSSPPSLCVLLEHSTHCLAVGKPGQRKGATEAPGSCCVSQKMQMASMRQRREGRDFQLPCCAGTCQPAEQGMDGAWLSTGTGGQLAKAREETALFFHG